MIWLCIAIAAAVYFWPSTPKEAPSLFAPVSAPPAPPSPAVTAKRPGFRDAQDAMAVVRNRLASTECLTEPVAQSINVLTLALMAGSDKE
jgi:hypothetical protein